VQVETIEFKKLEIGQIYYPNKTTIKNPALDSIKIKNLRKKLSDLKLKKSII